jgi:hypothetical protein
MASDLVRIVDQAEIVVDEVEDTSEAMVDLDVVEDKLLL